jgi:serine/threonine protein kinase
VIHRDLKSPNLLLTQPVPSAEDAAGRRDYEPVLKITDFGLARQKVCGPASARPPAELRC